MRVPAGRHRSRPGRRLDDLRGSTDQRHDLPPFRLEPRLDARTGLPRELHVEKALACIDFARGPVRPVSETNEPQSGGLSEQLVRCEYFVLRRFATAAPAYVSAGQCRILIALDGRAVVEQGGASYPLRPYDVMLLPPEDGLGPALLRPEGMVTFLDCWPL